MNFSSINWAKALTIFLMLTFVACSNDDNPEPIKVAGVSLNKTTLTLNVGGAETLIATVLPDNTESKTVTWASSATSVATVEASGKVTAVAEGMATITATCGDKTATCILTVLPIAVNSISLNKSTLSLVTGGEETLVATVLPNNTIDKTVTWVSSATNVATIDARGKVTAVAKGSATITATCSDKTATCEVTVNSKVVANGTTGALTWVLTDDGILTISGKGAMPNYTTFNTVPWYPYYGAIKTVVVEQGVTSIGDWAFNYYPNLNNITIPNGVITIGDYVFLCKNLASITIPKSVTSIGVLAFSGCSGLTSINIETGNSNYASEDGVLFDQTKTVLIKYPEGKTGSYTIPNSVLSIDKYAFGNCMGLTSINVGASSPSYASENGVLFNKEKSILIKYPNGKQGSSYSVPSSATNIEYNAFGDCTNLVNVTIPNSVISIGTYAFSGCTGLTSITLPNNLETIENNTFAGCNGLASISIPSKVKNIKNSAFMNCTNLKSVTILAYLPPTLGSYNFMATDDTLYVPKSPSPGDLAGTELILNGYRTNASWSAAFPTIVTTP